jgi:hypothetical protein
MKAIRPNVKFVDRLLSSNRKELFDVANQKDDKQLIIKLSNIFEEKNIDFGMKRRSSQDAINIYWKQASIHSAEFSCAITVFLTRGLFKQFTNIANFDFFKKVLTILVEHESIHKEQFRRASFTFSDCGIDSNESYFCDPQEAEPFAAEIVGELKLNGHSKKDIIRLFKESSTELYDSSRYSQLIEVLTEAKHRTVLNNIMKKVRARL